MNRPWNKTSLWVLAILCVCFVLFFPGFFTYFSQDDFIHLSFSLSADKVLKSFNIFQKGEFPFYRPIPTQLYYFINYSLFGMQPFWYHIVNFILLCVNIILVYRLVKQITCNAFIGLIAVAIFAINSTHFAPLYSPAYVHELFYVLFSTSVVYFFVKHMQKMNNRDLLFSYGFYILALMAKETAVVIPFILVLLYLMLQKSKKVLQRFIFFIGYFVILAIYLFGHFFYYGIAQSSSYKIIIGKETFNILIWYFLWALSTPNILIDFIGPGARVNNLFFTITGIQGYIYLLSFICVLVIGILLIFFVRKKLVSTSSSLSRQFISGILWFIIGLVPLIIFPLHKLGTEQAFSLIGLSMSFGIVIYACFQMRGIKRIFSIVFVTTYLIVATNSILLGIKTHWIVRSAFQASAVISYFLQSYPNLPESQVIYFQNGEIKIPEYGSAKQLYYALGNGVAIPLVYKNENIEVYFEDIKPLPDEKNDKNIIIVDSSNFLGY